MSTENLVWVKNGGSLKKVSLAKAKKLAQDGYQIGTFNKAGVFVPQDETAAKKENTVLKADNKKLTTENTKLKAELVALKAKTPE